MENRSALDDSKSVLDSALQNQIVGRIPWERFQEFPIENGCVKNGPIEARYAYLTTARILESEKLKAYVKGDRIGLYVGTMNNHYGLVGLRNGYRICANDDLGYDKATFESRIGTGYSYVHPMIPVYKIPNNVIANIALDFEIHGENANFFGEDSGCVALQESLWKLRNGIVPAALVANSNHLFINYLTFLFLEIHNFSKKKDSGINPESDSFFFPSEWASSFLFFQEEEAKGLAIEPKARLVNARQISYIERYFHRALPSEVVESITKSTLEEIKMSWGDLDLVVMDNLAEPKTSLELYREWNRFEKSPVPLLCPTLLTGHSICSSASTHLSIALKILEHQKVFSSYLKDQVPENPAFTDRTESLEVKKIGILTQGLNNSVQFMIVEAL